VLTTRRSLLKVAALWSAAAGAARASVAAARAPLVLNDGTRSAPLVVSASAGPWERRAAEDLARYIGLMTGLRPQVVEEVRAGTPAVLVGRAALAAEPRLARELRRAAKRDPVVQADAILVRRSGDHVLVLGSNDESHYFAAAWLLRHWGCRWYMPGPFGEHVPRRPSLSVGDLDHLYAPPFEIRHYWLSWNGDTAGADDFRHRNFMSDARLPGAGQVLDRYTAALAPPGGSHFNVPFADPATAEHVARQVDADYAAGRDISLAIADGLYSSDDPRDRALAGEYDRFMMRPSLTDAMLTLYNNVARILRRRHPSSRSRIGGLAYANVTLPPRQVTGIEPRLVMWIAPIDIDPNHAMDDPRSPPRQAYGRMVRRWAAAMKGRLAIYDYDQGMLVWRDLPNPSHHVFAREVKLYRAAGILGFGTESRGAFATTFLNLFFRGQLMWDPEAGHDALLEEFYGNFYGPAAEPMRRYWTAIFAAWEVTRVTEHEYPAIPAIYTPGLVELLRPELEAAERLTAGGAALLRDRIRFTRLSFDVIANYVAMVNAAAGRCNYAVAVEAGEKALLARLELARMNPIFTTRILGPEAESADKGAMWLPGEVRQYRELALLAGGGSGRLLARLPLVWSFRRAEPVPRGWTYQGPQGAAAGPSATPAEPPPEAAQGWRQVRSDLYLQAQGVEGADEVSALGHYWYRCSVELGAGQSAGAVRLMFPGLFNEAWLYVNGGLVAHRPYREPWWLTDYRFEWDVDLSGRLREGRNDIALRGFNPHHFAGIFRRPFLYAPAASGAAARKP
jgi:hypothetical protein